MNKNLKRALVAGAFIAGPALINNAIFANAKALGNPIGGEGRFWSWREGDVFYAKQGKGETPVLLLHGIYAGASIYEWRKNFDALGEHFTVYAIDWLGFGLSDKPNIRYTDRVFIELLRDFIKEVIGKPVAIIASSLGAAYAIDVAALLPDLIESLILVCPTGFHELSQEDDTIAQEAKFRVLTAPIIGTSLYNAISSRASLRSYLQSNVYFDPSYVTDEMIDHYSTATHQYGSQYAPLAFVSGELNHDIRETFPMLTQKTIRIVWGREAVQSPLSDAEPFLSANPNAELTVIDKAGLLPQDEQASAFNRLVAEIIGGEHGHADHNDGTNEKPKRKPRAKKSDDVTDHEAA